MYINCATNFSLFPQKDRVAIVDASIAARHAIAKAKDASSAIACCLPLPPSLIPNVKGGKQFLLAILQGEHNFNFSLAGCWLVGRRR